MWLIILSKGLKEPKVLEFFFYWQNYYLVSFESFPLFLNFLTSLINLTHWLKFFHRQKADLQVWRRTRAVDVIVHSLSHVCLFVTPWITEHQASLSFIISWSLLKFKSTESVMLLTLILCCPLLFSSPFLAKRFLPVSQLFTSGGQSIRAIKSCSISVWLLHNNKTFVSTIVILSLIIAAKTISCSMGWPYIRIF